MQTNHYNMVVKLIGFCQPLKKQKLPWLQGHKICCGESKLFPLLSYNGKQCSHRASYQSRVNVGWYRAVETRLLDGG